MIAEQLWSLRRLSVKTMKTKLSVGSRIKISENYHWAKNATGRIAQPPNYIVQTSDGWKRHFREVKTLKGISTFYWITFDESQFDADGDGPYQEAEIDSNFIYLG